MGNDLALGGADIEGDDLGRAVRVVDERLVSAWNHRHRAPSYTREQVPALLRATDGCLGQRGRPLLATLVGAGLRIQEALDLERRHVNLARGTLTVHKSKTEAGVRVVDLTPALRDELAVWLDRSPFKQLTDRVFPTSTGAGDTRQNVRRRLLVRAVEKANVELERLGIELIGSVPLHGLRRTYATLRVLSAQIGHENPTFTLAVYAQAVKHREKLTDAERGAYDEAIEWASMTQPVGAGVWASKGTNGGLAVVTTLAEAAH